MISSLNMASVELTKSLLDFSNTRQGLRQVEGVGDDILLAEVHELLNLASFHRQTNKQNKKLESRSSRWEFEVWLGVNDLRHRFRERENVRGGHIFNTRVKYAELYIKENRNRSILNQQQFVFGRQTTFAMNALMPRMTA